MKAAIMGFGTVGSGVYEVLDRNRETERKKAGEPIEIKYILNRRDLPGSPVEDLVVHEIGTILEDPETGLVVETMGGTSPAYEYVKCCLQAGKHVVTSNKNLVAAHGTELLAIAREKRVSFLFEASVGGGIPILHPLTECMAANRIDEVYGILNGTTNYILTRMVRAGATFADALREAQEKGYAEADPSADVDGLDAAAKIAILASIAFNSRVTMADVYTSGITNISPIDLEAAEDMGYVVKLLALAHRTERGVDVRVHPTMLPAEHQLAKVNGVYNAIYVTGDFVGDTMFFGEGAGAGAAASAVMGDVLEVARHLQQGIDPIVGCTCTDELPILPMEELSMRYYIRFSVADRPGVLAAMAGVFADHDVSVHSVMQRGQANADTVEIVYITHTAQERAIREVIDDIRNLGDILHATPSLIRVEA